MAIILYQFPLSHYCEKVRWALDHKGLSYETRNLVPGAHLLTTKRLASKTSVPILLDGKKVIQDSTTILDHLDACYPEHPLSASEGNLKKEAREWEEYFDKEIGVHLRRFAYFYLLQKDALVKSLLLQNAPWYGRPFYGLAFPLVKKLMKKTMNIHEASAEKSLGKLEEALDRLNREIAGKDYLVGGKFSRADLSAAALLGPLCTPPQYAFDWPEFERMPQPLQDFRKTREGQAFFRWVNRLYQKHRPSRAN